MTILGMQLGLTRANVKSIIKATAYAAASAGISYLISVLASDSTLFGPLTPVVNIALYSAKKLFEQPQG